MVAKQKLRLFAAMPFGKKKGHFTHSPSEELAEVDFDDIWENLLKPAIPSSEFEIGRADEFKGAHIEKEYIDWLRTADVVLADLTFGNANVYYELGLRYALSRFGTILVADARTELPFDTRQFRLLTYEPGNFGKTREFTKRLRETLRVATRIESPIYTYQPGLFVGYYEDGATPDAEIQKLRAELARLEGRLQHQAKSASDQALLSKIIANAKDVGFLRRMVGVVQNQNVENSQVLEQLGRHLTKAGLLDESRIVLTKAEALAPEDSEVLRELAFVYRKIGSRELNDSERDALFEAASTYFNRALDINPRDVEGLGMHGGLLRRLGKLSEARQRYEEAYSIDPNFLYAAIAVANIVIELGLTTDAEEKFRTVIKLAQAQVEKGIDDHWTYLSLGEANAALGYTDLAMSNLEKALSLNPPIEDVRSSHEQMEIHAKRGFRTKQYAEILANTTGPYLDS